jgi:hypothetical protein
MTKVKVSRKELDIQELRWSESWDGDVHFTQYIFEDHNYEATEVEAMDALLAIIKHLDRRITELEAQLEAKK